MAIAFRRLAPLALVLLLLAPAVQAQEASTARVLRTWVDDVKLDDGTSARWTFTITYDAEAGLYTRTVRDEAGAVLEETTTLHSLASPTNGEIEEARAIILAHPTLRELYDGAKRPVLEGGFELVREEGHACGPGSRCLQFDLYDVDDEARRVDRLRYVVVDLRTGELVSADFDASRNSNETRFNRDRRTDR
ncbi:MAG: hypothetical protein HKN04_09960 [Rhodothermaceae bacterium]|nr:hypothetical protein [Rhodothermaceae bacterium]